MIFSDLPESSPPTVNTGYFDEILACSTFVCWSNISMMNHWRCPPSNPGNEKSDIKLQRWKSQNASGKTLRVENMLSRILWVNEIAWMMDLVRRKRSWVQHMLTDTEVEVRLPKHQSQHQSWRLMEWLNIWTAKVDEQRWSEVLTLREVHGELPLTSQMFNENFFRVSVCLFNFIHSSSKRAWKWIDSMNGDSFSSGNKVNFLQEKG